MNTSSLISQALPKEIQNIVIGYTRSASYKFTVEEYDNHYRIIFHIGELVEFPVFDSNSPLPSKKTNMLLSDIEYCIDKRNIKSQFRDDPNNDFGIGFNIFGTETFYFQKDQVFFKLNNFQDDEGTPETILLKKFTRKTLEKILYNLYYQVTKFLLNQKMIYKFK